MGHGHVTPNPDGTRARCGGPAICGECALEYVQKQTRDRAREEALLAAKAAAWMAFAKGLAVMGNRDAGEHKHAFDSWWECYGVKDATRTIEPLLSERDEWKRRAASHGCDVEKGDPDCG